MEALRFLSLPFFPRWYISHQEQCKDLWNPFCLSLRAEPSAAPFAVSLTILDDRCLALLVSPLTLEEESFTGLKSSSLFFSLKSNFINMTQTHPGLRVTGTKILSIFLYLGRVPFSQVFSRHQLISYVSLETLIHESSRIQPRNIYVSVSE